MLCLAERLYDSARPEMEVEQTLDAAGILYEEIGWDHYDNSLELRGVPSDFRLTEGMQRTIHGMGFAKVYVNHTDKWETHYSWRDYPEFTPAKGWRVSYPHKRGEDEKGIWVEAQPEKWPVEWFKSGYAIVKSWIG